MEIILLIVFILLIILVIKNNNYKNKINEKIEQIDTVTSEYSDYKKSTENLRKYSKIDDVEKEHQRIIRSTESLLQKTEEKSGSILKEADDASVSIKKVARTEAKQIRDKAELKLTEANEIASKIEQSAIKKAEEIAGEAWKAKENAEQYEKTVKAMKNIIKGYGDEYLIPNHSLLDDLALEYDHKEAGQDLIKIRSLIKSIIKNGDVADCDYAEIHRRTTAIEFVIDAFNGKVDTVMAKVKHDNYGKMQQQLHDAFRIVNHNGKPFKNARINQRYFDTILEQLKFAVTVFELKKKDLEEQRRIREEMREEERARREFDKALKNAAKEEALLAKAMKEVEAKLKSAADEERAQFESELEKLKEKLSEAEEKGQRALSMAQQTKQGHVYIISNVGSFGEDILKIGLTRRLEPMERVKELGDASVPFSFDVHAMIHSDNAPKLEKELHEIFRKKQVNKINHRKEFFNVQLKDVKAKIEELDLNTHWTMKAEAREYRESLKLEEKELMVAELN